ncbi:MAG: TPM domain-containing protein [Proteobacteria bacterium]|nr:TPM domain-containing protein [Pseudomonadota bacterium]MBU1740176.1 TPM domain-containing protein [Pseudomonadota bacterium]
MDPRLMDNRGRRRDGPETRLRPGSLVSYARRSVALIRHRQQRLYHDLRRLTLFQRYLRQLGLPDGEYPAATIDDFLKLVRQRLGPRERDLFSRAIYGFLLNQDVAPEPVEKVVARRPGKRPPHRMSRPLKAGAGLVGPVFRTGSLVALGICLTLFPFFSHTSPLPSKSPAVVTIVRGRIHPVQVEMLRSGLSLSELVASRPAPMVTPPTPIKAAGDSSRPLARFVNDPDGVLQPWIRAMLADFCLSLAAATGLRPLVVTVEQTKFERTAELAQSLMAAEGTPKTVLLVIVKQRRAVHLRVGRALWGSLSPGLCGRILDRSVVPHLRQGRYITAIKAGLRAVAEQAGRQRALAVR